MTSILTLTVALFVLLLIQALAALPWLWLLDARWVRDNLFRHARILLYLLLAALVPAFLLANNSDASVLAVWGRIYAALLHLQIIADIVAGFIVLLLMVWPKGGAVTLAAFRESVRQPMYWLLISAAAFLLLISPWIPYFTFGEDFKMVKELGFELIMLFTTVFAVIAASTSVHEEIEGRTAVTLMSKPVSRRQFLIGKFAGILCAAVVMSALLGWFFEWMLLVRPYDIQNQVTYVESPWVLTMVRDYFGEGELADLLKGAGFWLSDALEILPGLVLGFCQVMVILAVAVALATRLSMVVNLPLCLVIFFLGHLTPILAQVSAGKYALVSFTAQLFGTLLPGLEFFSMGQAVVREAPLPAGQFALYTGWVSLYAVMYTAIALLFGLILFEDRDLA
jgi:ABC-type transport system involved in multi-copper enzyme maturation permease subunit